jgi:cytochrome c2
MLAPCGRGRASGSGKACRKAGFGVAMALAFAACAAWSADADRGRRLLTQYQCGSCHLIPGVAGATGRSAPPLAAFGKRSYIAGQVPNEGDALERWIIEPRALVPLTTMPKMGAGPVDARDMAAYLQRLQ